MRDVRSIAKALSDENRLRALIAVQDDPLCLCQIVEILGLSPATVSKHMNILEQAGLVVRTRRGKWRFYGRAEGSKSRAAKRALDWVVDELRGDPKLGEDARKIRKVRRQDPEELTACYRG